MGIILEMYKRRAILAGAVGAAAIAGFTKPLQALLERLTEAPATAKMPTIFIGHGTPMSAIQPNQWTKSWGDLGQKLPRPSAILAISAHWLTRGGSLVTMSEQPAMNYDMQGFPKPLYEFVYRSPGNVPLAKEISSNLSSTLAVLGDTKWGLDHGTWVVLKYLFPKADIPVIQLSIDYSKPPEFHYALGKRLQFLRSKGVLIFNSGNMVHNLAMRPGMNNDRPYDWAVEFDHIMWTRIQEGNDAAVADFLKLGSVASKAHPTYDHFLPLLYALGLKMSGDEISTFNDNFQWPAVSMRSLLIG